MAANQAVEKGLVDGRADSQKHRLQQHVYAFLLITIVGVSFSQTGFSRHASSRPRFLDASSRSFFDRPVSSTLPSLGGRHPHQFHTTGGAFGLVLEPHWYA